MASYERSPGRTRSPYKSRRGTESPQISPRKLPSPSPSQSLYGLEKVVPPPNSSQQIVYRSWDSTPQRSSTDVNKPLPHSPPRSRSSSVYSSGSGYTRIIESYGNEELKPLPTMQQPIAHRDTVPPMLQSQRERPCYADMPMLKERNLRASQSIPTLQYAPFRDERWNASAHELCQTPTLSEFYSRIPETVSSISSGICKNRVFRGFLSPPLVHDEYKLFFDQEQRYPRDPTSTSVRETVDFNIVPQPLRMSKTATTLVGRPVAHLESSQSSSVRHVELLDIKEAQRRAAAAKQADLEARAAEFLERRRHQRESNLIDLKEAQRRAALDPFRSPRPCEERASGRSRSESSDSFVIYTGVRESVKAMIRQKMKERKETRETEKAAKVQEREWKRVMSIAEEKYPSMKSSRHASHTHRKYSWAGSSGHRSSLSDGVVSLFRNLSISKTQRAEEAVRGRTVERGRRPKQLAVPPSPYQKYSATVWYAKNKKKKKSSKAKGGLQKAPTMKTATAAKRFVEKSDISRNGLKKKRSMDVRWAYQQGAKELRSVLHVGGKKSHRRTFGMTSSQERRERLKRSIHVMPPA